MIRVSLLLLASDEGVNVAYVHRGLEGGIREGQTKPAVPSPPPPASSADANYISSIWGCHLPLPPQR